MKLPARWCRARLGGICQAVLKVEPLKAGLREFQYLDISSIDNSTNRVVYPKTCAAQDAPSRARQIVRSGDILFCTVRTYLRNIAIVADTFDGQIASTGFCVIRPHDELVSRFFFYLSLSESFLQPLNELQRGSSYPAVRDGDVFDQDVPLAPVMEQRAIVAKIEALFSELDKGVEQLQAVRQQLKRYRQSVLKAAFEGKLTAKWREEQQAAGKLPSADDLLAQIKAEREARCQQQLADWQQAVKDCEAAGQKGKKPRQPAKPKKLATFSPEAMAALPGAPAQWAWSQVDAFAFVTKLAGFEYTKYVKYDATGDLPVLKAENAGRSGFRLTDFSHVRSETVQHLTRSWLHGGEVLMVFVGAGVGNVALVPEDRSYFLGPNICMIRCELPNVLPTYLEHYLRSPGGHDLALGYAKAVAQPSLSMGTIRLIPVVIPSVDEQQRIVNELESRFSVLDEMDKAVEAGLAQAEALRQSILKKAFEGRLLNGSELASVQVDPAYEPAEKLLERVRAQRASTGTGQASTCKGRKAKPAERPQVVLTLAQGERNGRLGP